MSFFASFDRLAGARGRAGRLDCLSIGVLYGFPSAEREISLKSGEAVSRALTEAGRDVHRVILDDSFNAALARSLDLDIAFLALHGEFGEDGRVQRILDEAGIPYTGSGADSSAVAFDKVLAKRAFERHGVLSPAWMSFEREELRAPGGPAALDLAPPLVVKPAASGSSLGITIVRHVDQIPEALDKALNCGPSVLVERFVAGRELTVAILGDDPLPVAELRVAGEFYDFQAKYVDPETSILCPADLPPRLTAKVQAAALAAHRCLGCRDLSRVDVMLDAQETAWVLEVNTLPGLTSHSIFPRAAASAGIDFLSLCEMLLLHALERAKPRGTQAA